jgi:hypothetical protein
VTLVGQVNAITDVTRVAFDVRSGTNADIDVAEFFAGQRMNHDKAIRRRLVHGVRSDLDELQSEIAVRERSAVELCVHNSSYEGFP